MLNTLNEEQVSAVLCLDKRILCLACAGSGKTTTMLERIAHLVETGVDPSSILVLTFTNAAAFEMKSRYQAKHASIKIPEFRTFHSFCYHVLSTNREIRKSLGYFETPTIADENTSKRIRKEAQTITGIKSSIESLEKKHTRSKSDQSDYELLKKTSSKLMRQKNTITFDELCSKICNLFKENSELSKCYKDKYKYIFVDEFQDTDSTQYEFVKSFSDSSIFVVGDALQALYSFRGADSSIIKGLTIDPEWTTIRLHRNYRSSVPICEFANENSTYADKNFRIELVSGNDNAGDPVICMTYNSMFTFENCLKYCLDDLKERSGSTAVLFRTNREVDSFQSLCEDANIGYRTGKKSADVENILLSIGDNDYLLNWLSTFLNSERYADFIRVSTLRQDTETPYGLLDFKEDFGSIPAILERWDVVRSIRRICKNNDVSVVDRCKDILEVIGCKTASIDESKCTSMKDAVSYILDVYKGTVEEPGTDVYVGTIHSVKGLEFDNVYVFGVGGSSFPLSTEDNLNVYYVAITRAKKHLVVFKKAGFNF